MHREEHIASVGRKVSPVAASAGFALPAAILALVVVGLLITGAIQVALRQQPIAASAHRATQVFYVAESGLNAALARWKPGPEGLRIWGRPDVLTGTIGQGEWEAEVRRVGEHLFFVRSIGHLPERVGAIPARRTVGITARAQTASFDVGAVFQTLGPVHLSENARIIGEDVDPDGWEGVCSNGRGALPALVTPPGTRFTRAQSAGAGDGPAPIHRLDREFSSADFDRFGGMAWDDLLSRANVTIAAGSIGAIAPSASGGECDRSDPSNWGDPGDPGALCGGYFPIVHLSGEAITLSRGMAQGILLVDGDLEFAGDFYFAGLVIAQGLINFQGEAGSGPSVFGAVSTRNPMGLTQRFTGNAVLQNSRCAVGRATANNEGLVRLQPLAQRGWVDLAGAS